MNEIEPEELLIQFVESIELLAATADEQIAWLEGRNVPISELTLQFGDVYPIFCSRLIENGLLDYSDIQRLEGVKAAIHDLEQSPKDDLFGNMGLIREAGEWQSLRNRAREALAGLQDHRMTDMDGK